MSSFLTFFYIRERTVAFLISQGAAPGALTDPTPKYPRGQTPADLASSNGQKGIAGYLAESALSAHLDSLNLKESKEADATEISGIKAVQTVSERSPTQIIGGDLPLKDSLAAVCNATQAAARIHQVFRVQSFQKKQLQEFDDGKFSMSDEQALSLLAIKTSRLGQHDEPVHAAAIRIQNKFRSWKGRKDFLIIRQRIVKIQVSCCTCPCCIILDLAFHFLTSVLSQPFFCSFFSRAKFLNSNYCFLLFSLVERLM